MQLWACHEPILWTQMLLRWAWVCEVFIWILTGQVCFRDGHLWIVYIIITYSSLKNDSIYQTGVINDPTGQPTVAASSDFRLILTFWDGQTTCVKIVITYTDWSTIMTFVPNIIISLSSYFRARPRLTLAWCDVHHWCLLPSKIAFIPTVSSLPEPETTGAPILTPFRWENILIML